MIRKVQSCLCMWEKKRKFAGVLLFWVREIAGEGVRMAGKG